VTKNKFLPKTRSKSQKPTKKLVILDFKSKKLVAKKKRKILKKFENLGYFPKLLILRFSKKTKNASYCSINAQQYIQKLRTRFSVFLNFLFFKYG
jgi:hypothetical protein